MTSAATASVSVSSPRSQFLSVSRRGGLVRVLIETKATTRRFAIAEKANKTRDFCRAITDSHRRRVACVIARAKYISQHVRFSLRVESTPDDTV